MLAASGLTLSGVAVVILIVALLVVIVRR